MAQVPASARDAVLARAAGLTGESRTLLDVAALTGNRAELRLLEAATACSATVADELLTCGLLAVDGDCLRFRHEIARLAVEQAIAAHRRTAPPWPNPGRPATRSGLTTAHEWPFTRREAGDRAAVLRFAPAAARQAAEFASHREAALQFQRALRFTAEADAATIAGLYDGLAEELWLLDRASEAADACERARELWRATGMDCAKAIPPGGSPASCGTCAAARTRRLPPWPR